MKRPPTLLTERACGDIMQAVAEYGDAEEVRAASMTSARFTSLYEREVSVRPEHDAVLRVTALVEVFFHQHMLTGKSYYLNQPGSSIQKWLGASSKADRNWVGRSEVWRDLFGVLFDNCEDFVPYLGFVEIRNVVAHGLGWLTDLQLARWGQVDDYLRALGVSVVDHRVIVTTAAIHAGSHSACGLVNWVDRESPF